VRATRLRPEAKGVDAFAPDPVGHLVKENDVETVEGIAQHTLALPETEVLAPRPLSLSSAASPPLVRRAWCLPLATPG